MYWNGKKAEVAVTTCPATRVFALGHPYFRNKKSRISLHLYFTPFILQLMQHDHAILTIQITIKHE